MYENILLKKVLLKIQASSYPSPARIPKLRVSSLPFCPLVFIKEVKHAKSEADFRSDFYFQQGHAVHNLWQNAAMHVLPKGLIGDFACHKTLEHTTEKNSRTTTRCNRVVRFCSLNHAKKQPCLHSKTVSREECHKSQAYQELEFKWKSLTGHTDFLYVDKKGRYHLIDFKTTSTFLFDKPTVAVNKGYYPSEKYKHQLETYVVLLERKFKIKIDTYTIAYVSRDRAVHEDKKPALRLFTQDVDNVIRKKRKALTLHYINQHRLAEKWQKANDKKAISEKLWEARPCKNKMDYLNKMRAAFFDECPFLERCLSGSLKKDFVKNKI